MKLFIQLLAATMLIGSVSLWAVHTYTYFNHDGKTQFTFTNTHSKKPERPDPKFLNNPCKHAESLQHCKELAQ